MDVVCSGCFFTRLMTAQVSQHQAAVCSGNTPLLSRQSRARSLTALRRGSSPLCCPVPAPLSVLLFEFLSLAGKDDLLIQAHSNTCHKNTSLGARPGAIAAGKNNLNWSSAAVSLLVTSIPPTSVYLCFTTQCNLWNTLIKDKYSCCSIYGIQHWQKWTPTTKNPNINLTMQWGWRLETPTPCVAKSKLKYWILQSNHN